MGVGVWIDVCMSVWVLVYVMCRCVICISLLNTFLRSVIARGVQKIQKRIFQSAAWGCGGREEEGIKCVCVCVRACVCVSVCANVCECVSSVCVNVRVVYVYV